MRRFLCCTALLIVACQGSVSEGTASDVSDPGTSNGSGSSGRSGLTGEGGTGGKTTKPSRSQGAAGTTSGGGESGTSGGTPDETGGTGGDETNSGTGGNDSGAAGGSRPGDAVFPDPMKDPDGFTALTKSTDTRVIYVSAFGSDSNDGLSEDKPLQTGGAGLKKLRDGFPDWLLFKRGDTFMGRLGNFKGSGRSETEPMVISAYGDGARPVFRTGGGSALNIINDGSGSPHHDHVWIIGLDFYANGRDPADADFNGSPGDTDGIHWRVGTEDLLIEDCVVRFYGEGMTFQDGDNLGMSGIRLRRNQFLDSYNVGDSHAQGIYIFGTNGMLFEENIFDHNGWNETVSGAGKTIFNHNIYCDNKNTNVVMKNNIFLRASSHGVQLRPGGVADGNLFAYNAIALLLGGGTDPNPGGVDGEANDNVVLLGTDIGSMPKQYGIDMENIHAFDVGNNIVANSTTAMAASPLKMNISGVTYTDNIVYNWPLGKSTAGSYPDPSRDLATYDATLAGPGTFDHFVEGLRSQSQQSWRTEYMAQTINAYIRKGFQAN